jgi:hypothetical protein
VLCGEIPCMPFPLGSNLHFEAAMADEDDSPREGGRLPAQRTTQRR